MTIKLTNNILNIILNYIYSKCYNCRKILLNNNIKILVINQIKITIIKNISEVIIFSGLSPFFSSKQRYIYRKIPIITNGTVIIIELSEGTLTSHPNFPLTVYREYVIIVAEQDILIKLKSKFEEYILKVGLVTNVCSEPSNSPCLFIKTMNRAANPVHK